MPKSDPFGLIASGFPPELAEEYRGLTRQQAIEQAMLERAMQPLGGARSAGRFMVAPHPLEGVAKVVQAYMARQGLEDVDKRMADLAKRYQKGKTEAITRLTDTMRERPGETVPPLTRVDDEGNIVPSATMPPTPPSRADVTRALLEASVNPYLRGNPMLPVLLKQMMPKEPQWEVKERFNPQTGRKEKVLIDLTTLTERPFGGVEQQTVPPMFKEVYLTGPKGEPMVQKMTSLDGGRTWIREGDPVPKFARQVAPVTVVESPDKYAPVAVVRRGPDGRDDPSLGVELVSRAQALRERRTPASTDPGVQAAIAGARETAEAKARRALNMAGLGDTIEEAEKLLTGRSGRALPTGSYIGTAMDWAGKIVGVSPEGAKEAQTLKAIAGALTSKMPRMEGPQSDKDVQLYREMAAAVGDSTLPRDRRIAALQIVKDLWAKYEHLQPQYGNQGVPSQRPAGRTSDEPPPGAVRPRTK